MRKCLRSRGHLITVAALAVASLGLVACAGPSVPTPSATAANDVAVVVYQPRSDIALGRVAVQVRNTSAETVTVVSVEVDSSSFADPLEWVPGDQPTQLRPGAAIDLRADLTAPACDSPDDRSVVHVGFRLGAEGDLRSAAIPIDAASGSLQTLHDEACLRLAVEEVAVVTAAEIVFTGVPGEVGTLRITIAPTGAAGTAVIDSISSTPLIEPVVPDDAPGVELAIDATIDADGPRELSIPIVTSRCDFHALAEDKVGTLVPAFVTAPDGTSGRIILPAAPEFRSQVYAFFTSSCGLG